jgi:hypothetical protein
VRLEVNGILYVLSAILLCMSDTTSVITLMLTLGSNSVSLVHEAYEINSDYTLIFEYLYGELEKGREYSILHNNLMTNKYIFDQ